MRKTTKSPGEKIVKDIKRVTRRHYSSEEKIRIVLVVLSAIVIERRAQLGGIQFGDAGDDALRARIRVHANLVEIAPMLLIGVALMEYAGASHVLLWSFAGTFFAGRLLHAARIYVGNTPSNLGSNHLVTPACKSKS